MKSIIVFFVISGFFFCLPSCKKEGGFFYYRITFASKHQLFEVSAKDGGEANQITWVDSYTGEFISQSKKPHVVLTSKRISQYGSYSLAYSITLYLRDRNGNEKTIILSTKNGTITWQQ